MDKKYPNLSFESHFKTIKNNTEKLANLAILSNEETIILLDSYDDEIYDNIVKRSNQIDMDAINLERECIKFMAIEQPYAKDLMYIEATIKIISHIKRIGRLTANIAVSVNKIQDIKVPEKILKELAYMGDYVHLILSKAISAFLNRDLAKARELSLDDDKIDDLCDDIFQQAPFEMVENEYLIAHIIDIILIARYYERIADRAVNIGSRTIFMMTFKRPDIPLLNGDDDE